MHINLNYTVVETIHRLKLWRTKMVKQRQSKLQCNNIEFQPFNSQITYTYHVHISQRSKHVENGSPGTRSSFRLDCNIEASICAISLFMFDHFNMLARQNREV